HAVAREYAGSCSSRAHTQGSRTRPGLHAVAREYGARVPRASIPRARGLALGYTLSPASTRARVPRASVPRARGLALGYTLSPASTRAPSPSERTQGSPTRLGLYAIAREYAGSLLVRAYPGLADSPWATRCRPRVRGLPS